MAAAHRLLAFWIVVATLASFATWAPPAAPAAASAPIHNDTESFARLSLGEAAIELTIEVDADHLMMAAEAKPPLGEEWSEADLRAVEPAALAWLADHWQLSAEGRPWIATPLGSELLSGFDPLLGRERPLRIAFRFELAAPARDVEATLVETLFEGLELGHRHWLVIERPGGDPSELRVPNGLPFRFLLPDSQPGAQGRRLRASASAGVAATFAAPWLLLFVAALLVAPAPARANARAVAAALAACAAAFVLCRADVIAPAPWAAEAAAALAVAYVAVENRRSKSIDYRVVTAALFGLVHGMALAPRLRRASASSPLTSAEAAAFAAAALLAALAAGLAAALLGITLRRRAPNSGARLVDLALIVAGAAGVVAAILSRNAVR